MMSENSILLIEDNFDDRFLLKKFLSTSGLNNWKIKEAVKLAEAIECLEKNTPGAILLDLSLPDSYGEDSFYQVKRNAPKSPIIILTGMADLSMAKRLIQKGAQDYIVKGEYNPRLLEKSIEYAIERHKLKFENDRNREKLLDSVLEAQDTERVRIAKELHDGVVQSLTVVSLSLGLLRSAIHKFDSRQRAQYEKCTENLSVTIDEIRNISHSLMPRSIAEMSLSEAIEGLMEDLEDSSEITFEFITNLDQEPEESLKLTIFRIVQELSTNAIKHSKANNMMVQLIDYPDHIYLMTEDDGIGFDKSEILESKNCFGLHSIESRVNSHGGLIEIDTRPGKGTNIFTSFYKGKKG